MYLLLGLLASTTLLLLLTVACLKRRIVRLTESVRQIEGKTYEKLFVKGHSAIDCLALEINKIENRHEKDILALEKLEQANRELLTNLSHDVRTPLTTLLGYLDALEEGVVQGEEKERYIKTARKKAYDLKRLVDELFDWFKIHSGEMKLQNEAADFHEMNRRLIIEWLPVLERHSIRLSVSIPEKEAPVLLDRIAYGRVFGNILQNAVEHSGCTAFHIEAQTRGDRVEICFRDDGVGINPKQLEHLFERLYKADSSRNRRTSGLGLAIARQLTERMAGTLHAESLPGKFTQFCIRFPSLKQ